MITNIQDLPHEILSLIAENLVGKEIFVFEGLSKLFRSICNQPVIWKRKIAMEFPGEIDLSVSNPTVDYKRMYLEYCLYTWFSVCMLQGNFEEIETFQLLCRNAYCKMTDIKYFCIFNTSLANSKKHTYKILNQKMTPPADKVLALKSYTGKNSTVHPENDIYVPYLVKEEVDYLLSENTSYCSNETHTAYIQQNCMESEEDHISHLMINDDVDFYSMDLCVFGRKIKRKLNYVYAFVSIYFSSSEYDLDPHGNQMPDVSKLNFVDFFENVEEIIEWMKDGNLSKASDIISNAHGGYKIATFGIGGEYYTYTCYSNLTNDIMKTLRLGEIYKLNHGTWGTNDHFEIVRIPVKEDSSFNFRNLPEEFEE